MPKMNLNMEKRFMLDGEEAEIVDSAISINNTSNLYVRNSVGKLPACQPRCAIVAGRVATMRISATFA